MENYKYILMPEWVSMYLSSEEIKKVGKKKKNWQGNMVEKKMKKRRYKKQKEKETEEKKSKKRG